MTYSAAGVTTFLLFKVFPEYHSLGYLAAALSACGFATLGLLTERGKPFFETLRGVAIGLGVMALVESSSVEVGLLDSIVLSTAASIYLLLRFIRLSNTCKACPHYREMPYCPGLSPTQVGSERV